MSCLVCQQIEKKIGILHETKEVIALIDPEPAVAGQLLVVPKKHHVILEQVPDWVMSQLFSVANKLSIALFEGLGAHGTNLLIPNGAPAGQKVAHIGLHIVPRAENDGMNLQWAPRQMAEDEMGTIEMKVKDELKSGIKFELSEPKPKEEVKEKKAEYKMTEEENYLIRSLQRIP
jgi:histidine triad (HIT) family protein